MSLIRYRQFGDKAMTYHLGWLLLGVSLSVPAADLHVTIVDRQKRPLADAVVSLHSSRVAQEQAKGKVVVIDQRQREFVPYVTVVQQGTQIRFPNSDNIRHHVYSFSPIKRIDLQLYKGAATAPLTFNQAGLAVLGCNIHDWMLAYVKVVDTPYFGRSAANGVIHLTGVAAGRYQMQVWHPRRQQPIEVPIQVGEMPQAWVQELLLDSPDPRRSAPIEHSMYD